MGGVTHPSVVWWRVWLTVIGAVWLFGAAPSGHQTASTDEVKAAFLFNFTKFVEWPADSAAATPFQFGVLGSDHIGDALREIVRGKTVTGRQIATRRVTAGDDLSHLHLLFVSAAEKGRLPDVIKRLDGTAVLTVSDVDKFCQQGGVIALALEGNHVRFDVNLEAAERSRLKVSSRLLSLARTVHPVKP
jgi:hypothetical protein